MSCTSCHAKFSFFKRENGCPNCGFSFCSKCLKYKVEIPNAGVKKVCIRCHNKYGSTDKSSPDTPTSPGGETSTHMDPEKVDKPCAPIDITRQLESLENPAKPPITMIKHDRRWNKLKAGLEAPDREIVDRLMMLKGENKQVPTPSVDEIRRRLALLKDQDPDAERPSINIHEVDTRTNEQKTDDLLTQYLEQLKLKSEMPSDDELQSRLDSLRDIDSSKYQEKRDEDDYDEEMVTKRMIKRALAEAELEKKYEMEELEELEATNVSDDDLEAPSCVTCDQTKRLIVCNGCNGDLYCCLCFEENHDDFEMKKHTTKRFVPHSQHD